MKTDNNILKSFNLVTINFRTMFLSANDIEDLYHSNLYINVATMQVCLTATECVTNFDLQSKMIFF